MKHATDFLMNIQRIIKLHEKMLKIICQQYELSLVEAKVISFLHNNPGKDTAADIVELRMLQKGNVSQAVETLVKKGLLVRKQDAGDRRKNHLYLTPSAEPVLNYMDGLWENFKKEIFKGLGEKEMDIFMEVNKKIEQNAKNILEQTDR